MSEKQTTTESLPCGRDSLLLTSKAYRFAQNFEAGEAPLLLTIHKNKSPKREILTLDFFKLLICRISA